jgi:hypothetical protein
MDGRRSAKAMSLSMGPGEREKLSDVAARAQSSRYRDNNTRQVYVDDRDRADCD